MGHSSTARVRVVVHGARDLMAADSNGLSDPYAKVLLASSRSGTQKGHSGKVGTRKKFKDKAPDCAVKTHCVKKDLNPVWDEGFVLPHAFGAVKGLKDVGKAAKSAMPGTVHGTEGVTVADPRLVRDGGSHFDVQVHDTLYVEVWDKDTFSDDFLGYFEMDLRKLRHRAVTSGWFKLEGADKGEVRLTVELVHARDKTTAYHLAKDIREMCKAPNKESKGKLWEDPDFVAGPTSLWKSGQNEDSEIEWLRPSQIAGVTNPKLIVDGVESGDVVQQALGDCYFLGAAAVVAPRTELLMPLFFSAHADCGFYQVRFWKDGLWQIVTIDDRLPCKNKNLIYGRCSDKNELWVPLLEKAFAKLHGCYQAIESGSTAQALTDLTGEAAQIFDWGSKAEEADEVHVPSWDELVYWRKEEYLMGCSVSAHGQKAEEEMAGGNGILVNHAYSILDVKEAKEQKFIQIRNPWGKKEWTGAYADNDSNWTPSLMKALGVKEFADDGTWWMTYEDFVAQFNDMQVLRLLTDSVGKKWYMKRFSTEWSVAKKTAGGCTNTDSWNENPQIGVRLERGGLMGAFSKKAAQASSVFVCVSQPDGRMQWNDKYTTGIGAYVMKTEDIHCPKMTYTDADIVGKMTFTTTRDVLMEVTLEPDQDYVIIPSTFAKGDESQCFVTIFSEHHLHAEYVSPHAEVVVKSEWKDYGSVKNTMGGCRNHDTWRNNPVFLVNFEKPLKEKDTQKLEIVLQQPPVDHADLKYIGMYGGVWPSDTADISKFTAGDCKYDVQCKNAGKVVLEVEVTAADLPLWVMPLTFDPVASQFELLVRGHRQASVKDARTGAVVSEVVVSEADI